MGIKSLYDAVKFHNLPFIEKFLVTDHKFRGSYIAIDTEYLFTQYIYGALCQTIDKSGVVYADCDPDRQVIFFHWVTYIVSFLRKWEKFGITPILVLEGPAPALKVVTKEQRMVDLKKKEDKISVLRETLRNMNPFDPDYQKVSQELNRFLRYGRYTNDEKQRLITILKLMGYHTFQSKTEGEKLCSMLTLYNFTQMVYSTDTDNFAYNCPFLVTKFEGVTIDVIKTERIREILDLNSHEQLVEYFILCGTDYNKNMHLIGAKKALKLIKDYGTIDNIGTFKDISCLNHKVIKEIFRPIHPQLICEEELKIGNTKKNVSALISFLEGVQQEGLLEFLTGGVKVSYDGDVYKNDIDTDIW